MIFILVMRCTKKLAQFTEALKETEYKLPGWCASTVNAHLTGRQINTFCGRLALVSTVNLGANFRPVITYLLVGIFIAIKGAGLYALIVIEGMAIYHALPVIGDDQCNGLLAAVISFWFGNRAMNRK